MEANWQTLAQIKRESIKNSIPVDWRLSSIPSTEEQRDVTGNFIQKYLNREEIEITETDATEIVKYTSTGQWKAEVVIKAFSHRASIAHQLTNCLHEIFFQAAIEDAKGLDAYYAAHKSPIGPLHGLPISLKDQFHVKDVETTMGYVGWIGTFQGRKEMNSRKPRESEMVRELRAMGALLYCKTAVPHTLMAGETVNNIIDYTWNPKNRHLSSGGSSGGEGALIGLKGSPVGFGTDIGGSIRIPAAFNGLYGLRPSAGRLPYEGMATSMDGQNSVLSVVGPLGRSVASLRLVTKSILMQRPWLHDPMVHEMPWRCDHEEQLYTLINKAESQVPKLAFGIMRHDGMVDPHPPVRRAMDIVVRALKGLGHTVIDWKPPSHKVGIDIITTSWLYDGGRNVHEALSLSGEPISPQVAAFYGMTPVDEMNATRIAATNVMKREYQKTYMDYWNSTEELTGTDRPVDAFIMPVAPFAAARPNKYGYYGYSTIVNLLDYTSCSIPITTVDRNIDMKDEQFEPQNSIDKEVADSYDPDIYDGAHVAVQLVGRRLQEEKVLVLAEHVGEVVANFNQKSRK